MTRSSSLKRPVRAGRLPRSCLARIRIARGCAWRRAALDDGDTLMVVRLDRLARSTRDLLNILHEVGDKGASFKSLHDCWADTTTPHGRLMLTILGGLAEFEGRLIKARTDVGVKRAREQGIRFGRPKRAPSGSARQRVRRCRLGPL